MRRTEDRVEGDSILRNRLESLTGCAMSHDDKLHTLRVDIPQSAQLANTSTAYRETSNFRRFYPST